MSEDKEHLSDSEVRQKYYDSLEARHSKGEQLTPEELLFLDNENPRDSLGDDFPKRLHVTRTRKPLTQAELEQRRNNSTMIAEKKLQTGPRTDEGKKRSAANALKHGGYAASYMAILQPCRTTCEHYPCSMVKDQGVSPGDRCLDRQNFLETFEAIENAIRHKEYEDFEGLYAFELAANLDLVNQMRNAIAEIGPLVKSIKKTSGKDVSSENIEYKLNPLLTALPKLMADLGLTLPEALITPQSKARAKTDQTSAENVAAMLSGSVGKLKSARQKKDDKDETPEAGG